MTLYQPGIPRDARLVRGTKGLHMKRTSLIHGKAWRSQLVAACAFTLLATPGSYVVSAQGNETAARQYASVSKTPAATGTSSITAPAANAEKNTARRGAPTRYAPERISPRAEFFYGSIWGVDSLKIKSAESNEMIRFSYRVLDPVKAKSLNDEKIEPSLVDPKASVKLVIPSLEKVGKLRQISAPEAGKMYWMAFSNKGRLVKPGDRVNVVIGNFHANGLVVE